MVKWTVSIKMQTEFSYHIFKIAKFNIFVQSGHGNVMKKMHLEIRIQKKPSPKAPI